MTLIGSNYVLFSVDLLNFLFMGEPRLHARVPTGHLGRWTGPVVHKSIFVGLHEAGENQILRVQICFLENTNFPLLNGSQIQNQEKILKNLGRLEESKGSKSRDSQCDHQS